MDRCKFESDTCDVQCKKYAMCSYLSIQKQISELQQQLNFIFTTLNNLIEKDNKTELDINQLNEKLLLYSGELLDLINENNKPEA